MLRWTNFICCNMASPLMKCPISQWFERWDAFWRCLPAQWKIRLGAGDRPHCSILLTATPLHIAWITPTPNWALSLEFSSLLLMSSTPSSLQPSFVIGCFLLVGIPHCLFDQKICTNSIPCPPMSLARHGLDWPSFCLKRLYYHYYARQNTFSLQL